MVIKKSTRVHLLLPPDDVKTLRRLKIKLKPQFGAMTTSAVLRHAMRVLDTFAAGLVEDVEKP